MHCQISKQKQKQITCPELTDRLKIPDIEVYLSRSLGLSLSVLGVIVLFFTGTIPLSSSIAAPIASLDDSTDPKASYAVPILRVTMLFHLLTAIYCYMRYVNVSQTGFLLGSAGYGALACMGMWCMVFGTGAGRTSKRTGADKRTTGFPFKNTSAYDKKKDRKMG
ncbi:uncharacterized protein A1O9_07659 [Exophiala aquamarina CBS 119918]|uniref:Uncharacterized protein n=1 Tax=Exophiala aquamarina CBS 119918 TaxID=1182545 RepID=A0A072P9X0_9EURO|nr:uncharacterized protein A1O9_07659 [Exophiala aquamarina CBS 119918]KEF56078.1 hypothetical protein A1O9_07659 [Exophiala aquamarina CBS 119918]